MFKQTFPAFHKFDFVDKLQACPHSWRDVEYAEYILYGGLRHPHQKNRRFFFVRKSDTIYQPLRSGRKWHKVNF